MIEGGLFAFGAVAGWLAVSFASRTCLPDRAILGLATIMAAAFAVAAFVAGSAFLLPCILGLGLGGGAHISFLATIIYFYRHRSLR